MKNSLLAQVKTSLVILSLLLLTGCMNRPLDSNDVNHALTPDSIQRNADTGTAKVMWGGVILNSANESDVTRLEVLSYPLDYLQRPMVSHPATGRFFVIHPGYLETLDFARGRMVTIRGSADGTEMGIVGETEYRYARLIPEDLHLWHEHDNHYGPYFSFGLSISISN